MKITFPLTTEQIKELKAGDNVYASGVIYTARDAAHVRMAEALAAGTPAPFEYEGNAVFYAGPCPAPPGRPIGSVGPTTAGRMDAYSPALIKDGLRIMIGKGNRSPDVINAIKAHNGLYLVGVGGVAALMAKCITKCDCVAYHDLGTEAVWRLEVQDMPLIVAIDSYGGNVYE